MKRIIIYIKCEFSIFYARNIDICAFSFNKRQFSSNQPIVSVVPEKVYNNLNDTKIIYKDNQMKSGIYRWVNTTNGSSYVGSSVDLVRRLRDYFSLNWLKKESFKNNSIIYKALLKNNYSNFRLEILEYCDKSLVIESEQYYLDKLDPTYNICKIAGSSLGRETKSSTRLNKHGY